MRPFFFSVLALLVSYSLLTFGATPTTPPSPHASSPTKLKKYRILSTVGRVSAYEPWSSGWTEVYAGSVLWETTLVQVHKGGTFSFELATKEAIHGMQGEAIQVKLGTPIVIRLNEDITRKMELGTYFVPNLPKNGPPPNTGGNPIFQKMSEAWQRLAAVAAVRGMKKESVQEANGQESALALRAKHLKLELPANGATVLIDKVPTEIRVSWQKVDQVDATYEVRLWRTDEARPGPLALTQIDFHNVQVQREGAYFLQVTTADGKYQSDAHQIFISLPISGRIAKKTQVLGMASLPIPLKLPPDGFIYQAKQFPVAMTFEWDMSIDGEEDPAFTFKVTDLKGTVLVNQPVSGRRFMGRFARPGRFKWVVTGILPPNEVDKKARPISSETYQFEIQGLPGLGKDPIHELLMANKSGVLYLEEGF